MPDREKVIKWLEELEGFLFKEYTNIKAEESKIYYDRFKSLSDALELLKEQEPMKPIYSEEKFCDFLPHCPVCKKVLPNISQYGKSNFCHVCGQALKWEEQEECK